jgi:hypothetical protein
MGILRGGRQQLAPNVGQNWLEQKHYHVTNVGRRYLIKQHQHFKKHKV